MTHEHDYDALGRLVGWRLKCRRLWSGRSQEQAAGEVGITRQTMGVWETNARAVPLWRLAQLCEIYGIDLTYLLRPLAQAEEVEP